MNYELESRLSQLLRIFVEVLLPLEVLANALNDVSQPVTERERGEGEKEDNIDKLSDLPS